MSAPHGCGTIAGVNNPVMGDLGRERTKAYENQRPKTPLHALFKKEPLSMSSRSFLGSS